MYLGLWVGTQLCQFSQCRVLFYICSFVLLWLNCWISCCCFSGWNGCCSLMQFMTTQKRCNGFETVVLIRDGDAWPVQSTQKYGASARGLALTIDGRYTWDQLEPRPAWILVEWWLGEIEMRQRWLLVCPLSWQTQRDMEMKHDKTW